jgi:hypothetical protein
MPKWFGAGLLTGERRAVLKAVAFDMFIHMPFAYVSPVHTLVHHADK